MSDALKQVNGKKAARAAKGKPGKKQQQGEFRFININWTEEMKSNVGRWLQHNPDWWSFVEQLVGSGYRVGIQYDEYNDCYSCSITNRGGPVEFRGACITARGGDATSAVARAVAAHYGIANEDWAFFDSPAKSDDLW